MPSRLQLQLQEHAVDLLGKTITAVLYYDILDNNGTSLFRLEDSQDRHELAWGVDLMLDDQATYGFTWDWFRRQHEYGLVIYPGGLEGAALKKGATRTQESESAPWISFLNLPITGVALSKGADACSNDPICDCRIDFDGGRSLWISARQANCGCDANGDDCVVIFSQAEASRLGVRVDAPAI